jgi:Scramblase
VRSTEKKSGAGGSAGWPEIPTAGGRAASRWSKARFSLASPCCGRRLGCVADHFAFRELRIRQPGKVLPGRARYEIFDPDKKLLAVAAETESRGVLNTMIGLVPGTRVLAVRTPAGEPILTLVRQDSDNNWLAAVTDPDGTLIGQIRIEFSRRHYTLLDDQGRVAGHAAGDLSATQFAVTGADGERYAQIRKTWAGLGKELLTSSDHYTVTFTGPVSPSIRTMIVMVPIVLDMTRHGPY